MNITSPGINGLVDNNLPYLFIVSVLKESLSRLEAASESRMEVAENYEKLSLFYNEVMFSQLVRYLFLLKLNHQFCVRFFC